MLVADIKGKLCLSELVSEDFLTSSVFSTLYYLGGQYLEEFLKRAVNSNGQYFCAEISEPFYDFWPWFPPLPTLKIGAEPDLVIHAGKSIIIIEAKNYSGKSGTGIEISKPDATDDEEKSLIVDQLARQYLIGRSLIDSIRRRKSTDEKIENVFNIFLTRHVFFPASEIGETLHIIKNQFQDEEAKARQQIYWLNWQKLFPILKAATELGKEDSFEYKISQDLMDFLDRRGLGCSFGFDFLDRYTSCLNYKPSDLIFYQKQKAQYWIWIDVYDLDIFTNDSVFYAKLYHDYWEYIDINSMINVDNIVFYGGVNQ